MIRKMLMAGAVAGSMLAAPVPALAQGAGTQFVGQMMLVPYSFCPKGWTEANGQTIQIQANAALFSLLGTTYGGNGTTNFLLPNLQGRTVIHTNTGTFSPFGPYDLGQSGGQTSVTLTVSQMPAHSHSVQASNGPGNIDNPTNALLADFPDDQKIYATGAPSTKMSGAMIGATGDSKPFSIMNPYLVLRWCIAMEGIYPTRP